jgi:hypothetical protein
MAESFYNRKERRKLAKKLGLNNKNLSEKERSVQRQRAQEAGRQIHMQFITEVENDTRKQDAEREARVLKSLVDAFGEEEGKRRFEANQKKKK